MMHDSTTWSSTIVLLYRFSVTVDYMTLTENIWTSVDPPPTLILDSLFCS